MSALYSNEKVRREDLETMIDQSSLSDVLDALVSVCCDKASHLREIWQDENFARAFERAASAIEAARIKVIKEDL